MRMLIILVYHDSNKNGDRLHHISWYGHRRGQYAFLVLKSRISYAFSIVNYCFGVFNLLFVFEIVMPIRYVGTLTQTRMQVGSLTFPDMGP